MDNLAKQDLNKMRRGILLFSGGFDSTVAALILAGDQIDLIGLTIDYPGRPEGEKAAVKSLSTVLPFSTLLKVSIEGTSSTIGSNHEATSMEGWIPYRNILFWTIAAQKAVLLKADFIAGGHDEEDDGKVFNDAGKEFFIKLKDILKFSGNGNVDHSIDIVLPITSLTKEKLRSIVNDRIKDLLFQTWSCWRKGEVPCQQCFACKERQKYFMEMKSFL